jgi:signal transduction histidine kinase
MEPPRDASEQLGLDTGLVRFGCGLLIAAAVAKATYSALFEPEMISGTAYWPIKMTFGFAALIGAYVLAWRVEPGGRTHVMLLVTQSIAAMGMIVIYPSFIVTVLMVVIAWQIAWAVPLRVALIAVAVQSGLLALVNCVPSPDPMNWLVLITTFGFEFFAVSAAHLARREADARAKLARVNDELRATQALVTESARVSERVRISRDLHDVLGHDLTSLAIHLDVASRMAEGRAAKHLRHARDLAGGLLDQVLTAVNQVRIQPVDLRETLQSIAEGVVGINVSLIFPDELFAIDAPRADTILRCVQELITNALRHADATELVIELRQMDDGALDITGRDNGHGGTVVEGAGLAGMRERFELLGGKLSITSALGRGLTVSGRIPAFGALA